MDVKVLVKSPGGHSSAPPPHTTLGYLAHLIVHLESHHEEPKLTRASPTYGTFQCIAAHAPDVDQQLKSDIIKSINDDEALTRVEKVIFKGEVETRLMRSLLSTTSAVDIVNGTCKSLRCNGLLTWQCLQGGSNQMHCQRKPKLSSTIVYLQTGKLAVS